MTEHNLFYYPFVKDANGQYSLLKVVVQYFNELGREIWANLDLSSRRTNFRWDTPARGLKGQFGSFNEASE